MSVNFVSISSQYQNSRRTGSRRRGKKKIGEGETEEFGERSDLGVTELTEIRAGSQASTAPGFAPVARDYFLLKKP